jgi:hypothetical protein
MNEAFSNRMLSRFAVSMAICVGGLTYVYLGFAHPDTEPRLSPVPAGTVSYSVAVVVFYLVFGLLSMHWFGRRYWILSAVWGIAWLAAFYVLGTEWLEPIALAFTFLTVLMIGITLPKGGLTVPADQWEIGRRK